MSVDWLTVLHGDCRDVLTTLPDESVHCVVTSPPYWGLRDYGTAAWDGGDVDCDHRQNGTHVGPRSTLRNDGREHTVPYEGEKAVTEGLPFKDRCGKCGATRVDAQIGLEPTPEEYVAAMVGVFREVRRVLRRDGTLWLNLGDSYSSQSALYGDRPGGGLVSGRGANRNGVTAPGLKPKDLVGIPWRVAFALQADGWYLRSDIIWSKPNPMPESVTDRPTKSHEYLFLLTRSERYHYDADAIREEGPTYVRKAGGYTRQDIEGEFRTRGGFAKGDTMTTGRNARSVWTIATAPYPGAHFATFPPKLVEPCILAGCPETCCAECGAPWERQTVASVSGRRDRGGESGGADMGMYRGRAGERAVETTGWRPTCAHDAGTVPGVTLDPFAGTGTVGMVAQKLSRRAVLIDLNGEYLDQLRTRNAQTPLGLSVA